MKLHKSARGKINLGSRGNYFQGFGEIHALFSGIKGAQNPVGALVIQRITTGWLSVYTIEPSYVEKTFYETRDDS